MRDISIFQQHGGDIFSGLNFGPISLNGIKKIFNGDISGEIPFRGVMVLFFCFEERMPRAMSISCFSLSSTELIKLTVRFSLSRAELIKLTELLKAGTCARFLELFFGKKLQILGCFFIYWCQRCFFTSFRQWVQRLSPGRAEDDGSRAPFFEIRKLETISLGTSKHWLSPSEIASSSESDGSSESFNCCLDAARLR